MMIVQIRESQPLVFVKLNNDLLALGLNGTNGIRYFLHRYHEIPTSSAEWSVKNINM